MQQELEALAPRLVVRWGVGGEGAHWHPTWWSGGGGEGGKGDE